MTGLFLITDKKDVKWSDRVLCSGNFPAHSWREQANLRNTTERKGNIREKILTRHLQNAKLNLDIRFHRCLRYAGFIYLSSNCHWTLLVKFHVSLGNISFSFSFWIQNKKKKVSFGTIFAIWV